jgi:SagB-type dehydrogenase family enzyme
MKNTANKGKKAQSPKPLTRRQALAFTGMGLLAAGLVPKLLHAGQAASILPDGSLPPPQTKGLLSVSQAMARRRTVRSFTDAPLTPDELSALLWAAQGISGADGVKRTAPSAGARYPLDVYAATGPKGVEGLEAGLFHYLPGNHKIAMVSQGDIRRQIVEACLNQQWMASAPVHLVITAEYSRIRGRYGARGERYAFMESGSVAQNVFLMAQDLGLAVGIVGAFKDDALQSLLKVHPAHEPLLVLPIGRP